MDTNQYSIIQGFVKRNLFKKYHDRHFEDCVQHVAMNAIRWEGKQNWKHSIIDYCRSNGLLIDDKKNKKGAIAIENSISFDHKAGGSEGTLEDILMYEKSIETHEENQNKDNTAGGVLEEFLAPLEIKKECRKWILKIASLKIS